MNYPFSLNCVFKSNQFQDANIAHKTSNNHFYFQFYMLVCEVAEISPFLLLDDDADDVFCVAMELVKSQHQPNVPLITW